MIFAFATAVLFALSSVLAAVSVRAVGTMRANIGRLVLGVLFLGTWAHTAGSGLSSVALAWFLWSGVVGMGIGDAAFFSALPRLGTRLTTILMQCLAVPVAIFIERIWLGTSLNLVQAVCIVVILAGLVIALLPTKSDPPKVQVRWSGVWIGALAAAGQGVGAVLSRQGFAAARAAGETLDGLTAAYHRILGGLALTLAWYLFRAWQDRDQQAPARVPLRAHGWIVVHALAGPVLGMGAFQLALASAPSGIVLPITACAPLVVIPLTWWLEGERPSRRSLLGGVLAVLGAVGLSAV